jgi:predicted metalloendopeptidase
MSAQSKHELGLYVGEWIKKGYLENLFRLYTTISEHEDKVCYTICPDEVTLKLAGASQGDDEEGEEARHFKFANYQKYTSMTRGGEDLMSSIVAGMGLDPNCFMIEDSLKTLYENFNAMSLDELKATIIGYAGSELYMYCGDDNTSEATNGYTDNTRDVLDAHLRHLLTYPLSYYYCEKYVDDEVKAKYGTYAETIRSVFAKRIENNSWLSGETKEKALEKLNNMKFFIGEPDEWNLETFPKLNSKLFVENILEAKQSRINTALSLIGKPKRENCIPAVILAPSGMGTYAYNAFYIPSTNAMTILNCFMTAPEYTEDMQPADLYALFYVIGHELTHGFDKKGSQYDANGNLNNWWTAEDKEKFDALNDDLAQQISTFEIAPGIMANGYRTVTEDVADLGGFNIAFDALNEYLAEHGVTGEELKEAQKAYFERHAYRYRSVYSKKYFQEMLNDTHSVSLVRVNGMVQHMDAWYDLYNVSEGDSLYLPADKRITIW